TPIDGHRSLNVAAPDNFLGEPTAELLADHVGAVPGHETLTDDEAAISTAAARECLGWEPTHSWKRAADADVSSPFSAD
ncbi:MAG: NAD(P)-dependent oxidoreductase, partial [Halobaculum sp.]